MAVRAVRRLVVVSLAGGALLLAGLLGWRSNAPPSPGPRVQALLDHYAPDLRIGDRVSDAARRRYALRVAPYLGYRDRTYLGPDALRDLAIRVDDYVDDGDPEVSRWARIEEVILVVPDSASARRVDARVRQVLGEPATVCYLVPIGGAVMRRDDWRAEHGRGVRLMTVVGVVPERMRAFDKAPEPGTGWVSFGAPAPERRWDDDLERRPCP